MRFYDEDFKQSFAPKNDIFGMISDIIGQSLNYDLTMQTNDVNQSIAERTNASNERMNTETNKTNKQIADEANALAQAEADKAYERSTASNQIEELVKAGYSPQQARTIVAGTGANAAYTAAPIQAAQMNAAHNDPYSVNAPQIGSIRSPGIMQGLGTQLASDLQSPDGGVIGQTLYNDVSYDMQNLPGYDPSDFYSIEQFTAHALEKDADGNFKRKEWADFVNTKKFQKLRRSFLGKKAFNNAHSEFVASRNNAIQMYRGEIAWDMDKVEMEMKDMSLEQQQLFQRPQIDLALKKFSLELDSLDFKAEYNTLYLRKKLERMLAEEDGQLIMAEILKMKNRDYRDQYKKLGTTRNFVSMMHIFDEAGLTKTDVGAAVAALQAAGLPITQTLQKVVDGFYPTDDKGEFSGEKFKNGFTAGYREFQDIVGYPARATWSLITDHHLPPLWQNWEEYSKIGIHQQGK